MTRLILLVLPLLLACSRPVAPMPAYAASTIVTPWCVALVAVDQGVEVDGRVCTGEAWSCERVRAAAVSLGWMAGIESVGECVDAE